MTEVIWSFRFAEIPRFPQTHKDKEYIMMSMWRLRWIAMSLSTQIYAANILSRMSFLVRLFRGKDTSLPPDDIFEEKASRPNSRSATEPYKRRRPRRHCCYRAQRERTIFVCCCRAKQACTDCCRTSVQDTNNGTIPQHRQSMAELGGPHTWSINMKLIAAFKLAMGRGIRWNSIGRASAWGCSTRIKDGRHRSTSY
jgi:hypothetical protein